MAGAQAARDDVERVGELRQLRRICAVAATAARRSTMNGSTVPQNSAAIAASAIEGPEHQCEGEGQHAADGDEDAEAGEPDGQP